MHVIVGLGKTGLSCLRYLVAQGVEVAVTDSRVQPPGLEELRAQFPTVPVRLGDLDAELCANAKCLVVSPGVSLREPAIAQALAAGVPAVGDIELFAQRAQAPIVAITGSNGKSTVTTLVGEMAATAGLRVGVGGNLGTPALELLAIPAAELYVLELSSFQLETTHSLQAAAAVILNLSADHMDRYHSLEEYLRAKQRIYHQARHVIVNRDDPFTWQGMELNHPISFGLDAPAAGQFGLRHTPQGYFLARGEELLLATSELLIKGRHQYANALAALALGEAVGLPMSAMLATLRQFHGLTHRCQWVANKDGVSWYNDSKATNVGAAIATLEGLGADLPESHKLIVIAGGQGKNADFTPLRSVMAQYVRTLILIGQDAPLLATALHGSVPIQYATDLTAAVQLAQRAAQPGDCAVLAPACASFDMFNHFEHRGEVFVAAVHALL